MRCFKDGPAARPRSGTLRVRCTNANERLITPIFGSLASDPTSAPHPGAGENRPAQPSPPYEEGRVGTWGSNPPVSCQILTNLLCAGGGLSRRVGLSPEQCRCNGDSMFFANIFSRLSVRARIVVLGVIPVVGFLANGIAFLTGDTAVESAFNTVHRNTEVADASRDLKAGLLAMRAATSDFVAHPSDAEVKNFDDGQAMAMACLDRIQASLAAADQDSVMPLRITVSDLKATFDSLVNEQKSLGYDEAEGVTAGLIAASNAVENVIHNDLSWIGDVDRANLTTSLLTLRRYENEYRLTRNEAAERHYLDEAKHFNELFESVDGAPAMKEKLNKQIQTYSSTFAQWVASTEDITPLVSLINHDTESVLPEADKIIAAARDNARSAAAELAAPRTR